MTTHRHALPAGWAQTRLSDLGFTYGGLSGKSAGDFGRGQGLYVPFTNVIQNVRLNPSNLERVQIRPGEAQNSVMGGDLLLNASSETPDELGMACYVEEDADLSGVYLNSFCFGFRVTAPQRMSPEFLAYQLRGPVGRTLVAPLAQGFTRYNLSKQRFLALEVPAPPRAEQKEIATALRDVDSLIDSLDELIAKKRDLRTATRQALMGGVMRIGDFSGEWRDLRLGDVAQFAKGSGLSKSSLARDGEVPCVHYGQLFTQYRERIDHIISRTTRPEAGVWSKAGQVLMPTSDVTPNGLATASCIKMDGVLLGGDILIITPEQDSVDGEFLAHSIAFLRDEVMRYVSGTTVYHLSAAGMANFEFRAPPVREQKSIAGALSNMDAEIEALVERRAKTALVKQGMMQVLLTGRKRLVA